MNKKQLEFTTVLNHAFGQYERKIFAYIAENREKYEGFARMITPTRVTSDILYERIAFAILSANAPFGDTVKALNVAIRERGHVKAHDLAWYKMVPAKAKYLNALHKLCTTDKLAKQFDETWHDYRLRLQREVKGLGIAKASFAACLLYPLVADLACVDTWIQKVFLGHSGFKQLGLTDYLIVESKIRTYANAFGMNTFLAQWLIWDHARGGVPNDHAIFPGTHKR